MSMSLPRLLMSVVLLSLAGTASARTASQPLPLSAFFDNPAFSAPQFSPDGRHLAIVLGSKDKRDRLAVVKLDDMSAKVVAHFAKLDVGNVEWVNNERLVFDSRDSQLAPGDRDFGPGLWAVNLDGSGERQLVQRRFEYEDTTGSRIVRHVLPWNTFLLHQTGAQDSSSIYVLSPRVDGNEDIIDVSLLLLDTLTGRTQPVARPANVGYWLLDHKGKPRLTVAFEGNKKSIHYLDPGNDTWRKIAEFETFKEGQSDIVPLGFGPNGTLYVNAYNGANFSALHTLDVKAGKLSKDALINLEGFDFDGSLVTDKERLLGISFVSDASSTVWYDKELKAVQAKVDALLPGTVNHLSVPRSAASPWVLVASYSDRQPIYYRLYHKQTKALTDVGGKHPSIDPNTMATQDLVRYKARDGLMIPAWLTLPKDAKKDLPMVVLVHGGPFVRGNEWGWDPQVQFLASRGYAVLEPEFRGSLGFGSQHFRAGLKQWGLAMQDDLADGVRWAVSQGIANGKRVCIAGASYGGYAALMGVVKDAELYQCAINWAGVTDLDLLYQWRADSDSNSAVRDYGWPLLLGDRVRDAERLKATSPVHQAARITRPVLLAYGSADRRVPLVHGRKFYDAVKVSNPQVEWVVYPEEGHGWTLPANRIDFWGRVEKFLEKHIGKP